MGLLFTGITWASISITPAVVSVDLEQGRPSGRFVITNTGDKEQRYRILATHFNYSPEGGLGIVPPDENSLAEWLKFNPREFTLPPKSKRVVRYAILPRGKLSKKTYWAAMELESLNPNEFKSQKNEAGSSYSLKVATAILVPIFGTVGDIIYSGDLENLKLKSNDEGYELAVDVVNTGEGRLSMKGNYHILAASGEEVATNTLASGLVLPNAKRHMISRIPTSELKPGDYNIKLVYTSPGLAEAIVRELPISVK